MTRESHNGVTLNRRWFLISERVVLEEKLLLVYTDFTGSVPCVWTSALLEEGSDGRTAIQFATDIEDMGAHMSFDASGASTSVWLTIGASVIPWDDRLHARDALAGRGWARRGMARQGAAWQGTAWRGAAGLGKAGKAGQGQAWQGTAWHGRARQGMARRGKARHGNETSHGGDNWQYSGAGI